MKDPVRASVVIATRHRPVVLLECLQSLQQSTTYPLEAIIADSSDDQATQNFCESLSKELPFPLVYKRCSVRSAAVQRNIGAELATGSIIVFLDDDVVLDPRFLAELLEPFDTDTQGAVGGIAGTITNELPAPMSRVNRMLLQCIVGVDPSGLAGELAGPAVHFPFQDGNGEVRKVGWLPTCCCAYRKEVFEQYLFANTFVGYSFMEDVELSARIGRNYRLLQATGAKLRHKGLGASGQADWVAHGESRILNRHYVMTHALGKRGIVSLARLLGYELAYSTLAGLWNGGRGGLVRATALQFIGRLRGAAKILSGRSPHQRVGEAALR